MVIAYKLSTVNLTDIPRGAPKRTGPFEKLLKDIELDNNPSHLGFATKIEVASEDIEKARASINRTIRRFSYNMKLVVRDDALYLIKKN